MSGHLRSAIGPTRARLSSYLKETIDDPLEDPKKTTEENLQHLHDIKCRIINEKGKITRVVDLLHKYDQDWIEYIKGLPADDRKSEEDVFEQFMSGQENHHELILAAQEKLAEYTTLEHEIYTVMSKIQLGPTPPPPPTDHATGTTETATTTTPGQSTTGDPLPSSGFQDVYYGAPSSLRPSNPPPSLPTSTQHQGPLTSLLFPGHPTSAYAPGYPTTIHQTGPPVTTFFQEPTPSSGPQQPSQFASYREQLSPTIQNSVSRLQLPKQRLPEFFGDPLAWKSFWDMFESSIHRQPIPDIEKFTYLKLSLKGNASKAIEGISVTNENYFLAISILREKFGDDNLIIDTLYAQLKRLPKSSADTARVSATVDAVNALLRQLHRMGELIEQRSLLTCVMEKFPEFVLYEVEHLKPSDSDWTTITFLEKIDEFVKKRKRIQRVCSPMGSTFPRPVAPDLRFTGVGRGNARGYIETSPTGLLPGPRGYAGRYQPHRKGPASVGAIQSKVPGQPVRYCKFCNGNHSSETCDRYPDSKARKERAVSLKLCFNCLNTTHAVAECRSTLNCRLCNKRHHTALCMNRNGENPAQNRRRNAESSARAFQRSKPGQGQRQMKERRPAPPAAQVNSINDGDVSTDSSQDEPQQDLGGSYAAEMNAVQSKSVLLMSAKATVQSLNTKGTTKEAVIFFDSGSTHSFVSKNFAKSLGLEANMTDILTINTFSNEKPRHVLSEEVSLAMKLKNGTNKVLDLNSIEQMHVNLIKQPLTDADKEFFDQHPALKEQLTEEFPLEEETVPPDILIGQDFYFDLVSEEKKIKLPSGRYLIPSTIGLIICGKTMIPRIDHYQCSIIMTTHTNQALPKLSFFENPDEALFAYPNFEDFLSLEAIGIKDDPVTKDDDIALLKFNNSIRRDQDGRYEVEWPFHDGELNLPDNKAKAFIRFKNLVEKRLKNDPVLLKKCGEIFKDQKAKDIIELVPDEELESKENLIHYIPHHAVITPDKTTTKTRIVFDASARERKGTNSLNDSMYRGPSLLPDLCGLLLRFLLYQIVIVADIEKAFLQISVAPHHRDVTRFFWLTDDTSPTVTGNTSIFRFRRVSFGVKASPFLLNATVKYHLQQEDTPAAKRILQNIYVDNVLIGVDSVEEAKQFYQDSKDLFTRAHMNLREYTSNNKSFRDFLPSADRTKSETVKVLGLPWFLDTDEFSIPGSNKVQESCSTKREILQSTACIFDPLGMWGPVTLKGKLFFKTMWELKLNWNDKISPELQTQWKEIAADLKQISDVRIPRLKPDCSTQSEAELHVFVDASKKAYAAVAFLRVKNIHNDSTKVSLLMSKNKLVSTVKGKDITLPRLELMGMLIGTRLAKFISNQISGSYPVINLKTQTIWSDSECCLYWLQTRKPLSVFIENRLKEIRSHPNLSFKYVPTEDNPADFVTRGLTTQELSKNRLWWNGPSWLAKSQNEWPVKHIDTIHTPLLLSQLEVKDQKAMPLHEASLNVCSTNERRFCIEISRFSSHKRLIGTAAYVIRFLKIRLWNRLDRKTKDPHQFLSHWFSRCQDKGSLTADEKQVATVWIEKNIQLEYFSELMNSGKSLLKGPLRNLRPFLDSDGRLRSQGRLGESPHLQYESKYPVLLPKETWYTRLFILRCHRNVFCQGTNSTLAETRKSHWILKGRAAVKKVIRECVICKKFAQKTFRLPAMPPLPESRVKRCRPFENVGLDFAGPFTLKINPETVKVWICLFTCLVIRAVHLEVVLDLSGYQFLSALRRFIARRGKPNLILSDNATNFQLVQKTLSKAWNVNFPAQDVLNYCSAENIKWKFITERAPWQGGVYERMVGIMKHALKKAVGKKQLTLNEFWTYVTEVEAVINSRPLCHMDSEDFTVLRPMDFLLPDASVGTPTLRESADSDDPEFYLAPSNRDRLITTWESSQQYLDYFWNLWNRDYISSLREKDVLFHKEKRSKAHGTPAVGDVIMVQDEDVFQNRGCWQIGRITKLLTGRDDVILSAEVQLPNRRFITRPLSALCPLEVEKRASSVPDPMEHSSTAAPECRIRRNLRQSTSLSSPFNIALLFFLLLVTGSEANRCPTNKSFQRDFKILESSKCVQNGVIVYKHKTSDVLCYVKSNCTDGTHWDGKGKCGLRCSCPEWASDCSHYEGSTPQIKGDQTSILEFAKPVLCSLHKPSSQCNPDPSYDSFHQIELYSGEKHLVKYLEIQVQQATNQEFHCVGSGPTTGTPEYCEDHDCSQSGTRFCYFNRNDVVYFVSEDGKILIKAWGRVRVKYFGPRNVPSQTNHCNLCSISCIKGGVELILEEHLGMVEVCSTPYCYQITSKKQEQKVMLPPEITTTSYEVNVKIWSNGFLIKDSGIICPASPFCETITCYICVERIANPQCSKDWALFLVFLLLYFGSLSLYMILRLLKYVLKFVYYFSYCIVMGSRFCYQLCSRAKSYLHRPFSSWRRRTQEEDEDSEEQPRQQQRNNNRYRPRLSACLLLLCLIHPISGCSEVSTLTAQQSLCTQKSTGELNCVLSETTRLALSPQGQDTCLLIRGPNQEPMGTIAIEVKNIGLRCQVKNEYFTRSFEMKVGSSKRCPNAGQCTGDKCQKVDLNFKIDGLDEANKYPGFSRCSESCGCAACACFYCTSGCLFYRTYAKPTSQTVFEMFSCPTWEYKVKAKIRVLLQGKQKMYEKDLEPGRVQTFDNIRLSLVGITSPPVPILGSQFLTDGTRVIMVKASASGQPVSGTLGELQCASRDKATSFDCYLPKDSCHCDPQETTVRCQCSEMQIEPLFQKPEFTLPLISENIALKGTGKDVIAEFHDTAALELQLSMEGFRLATKVEDNTCIIKPHEFGGCYACLSGAKVLFTCTTNFGEALAQVTCGNASFSTVCTPSGVKASAVMNFAHAFIDVSCSVRCPGGVTSFKLEQTLVFIEKDRLGNISNIIASVAKPKDNTAKFDFCFLSGILSGNWFAGIFIIICVVILCIITVIFLPPLANYLFFFLQNNCRDLKRKIQMKLKRN